MPGRARALPPGRVRRIGISLNGGRIHGWVGRVSELLDVPQAVVTRWAAPVGAATSRAIPGPAATLLLAYAALEQRSIPPDSLRAMVERYREGEVDD